MPPLLDRRQKTAGVGNTPPPGSSPQSPRMFSCVGCFWLLLSSALVAVCSFSFISPAWIVKEQLKNKDSVSFGLLWHCSESLDHMYRCYTFGGIGKFAEIPSSSWQVSKQVWQYYSIREDMQFPFPAKITVIMEEGMKSDIQHSKSNKVEVYLAETMEDWLMG
ncbi:hypothetical protein Z043_121432 [Scleropages formosus]|uniref:Uncharacterized protein n=1 Tax=Scleropages formosus TaxID=113540 RepID=A0A0P7TI30_SCLFO|nr:hypothetical protein Z043_121432 [Scleropages formosus]